MSKKPKISSYGGYLKCTECSQVTAINVVPFSPFQPKRTLDCGCQVYGAVYISKSEGFDAMVRQQVEGIAA
jgi:hypothetical protein